MAGELRAASLGSGSSGNSTVVEGADTRLLIDCGFGPRVTERRLRALGVEPDTLDAVVVSHEHEDHLRGLVRFADRYDLPVHATHGTLRQLAAPPRRAEPFYAHHPLHLGGLTLEPFPVVHDATEPCQFVVSDGRRRLGLLTDTGTVTPHILEMLGACDGLLLECNYDMALLRAGPYPYWLQKRISGAWGHLANEQGAALLQAIDAARLQWVLAGHLSERNNSAEAVHDALASALAGYDATVEVLGPRGEQRWCALV
ncbi:MAG: MBL fold metallo-hydrolase [Halofilum sp. (in: g-proteobacteria)]